MKSNPEVRDEPLWKEEFSVSASDERYVSRRQFGKFLVLTSLGMFVGNLWILVRSWLRREPANPLRLVARVEEIPVGGVWLFRYPGPEDACILIRPDVDSFFAFSQKCTHLSCAVYYAPAKGHLECPCHEGFFEARTGRVIAGPPKRPLPKIVIERRGSEILARGVDLQTDG
jgi:arsenite oxidase small subunit